MILIVPQKASILMYMIPGSKGLNPHELAHRWVKDIGENCESAQHGTIRRYQSRGLLTPTSCT